MPVVCHIRRDPFSFWKKKRLGRLLNLTLRRMVVASEACVDLLSPKPVIFVLVWLVYLV